MWFLDKTEVVGSSKLIGKKTVIVMIGLPVYLWIHSNLMNRLEERVILWKCFTGISTGLDIILDLLMLVIIEERYYLNERFLRSWDIPERSPLSSIQIMQQVYNYEINLLSLLWMVLPCFICDVDLMAFLKEGGDVGIFDATNTTRQRRFESLFSTIVESKL